MIRVTRRYRFSASHRLHSPQLSDDDNRELYGKCNNPYGHGHDYVLDVSVAGPIEPATGRAVDLAALDALVSREVLGAFDHKNLNAELADFAASVPTTENLAQAVRCRLAARWSEAFGGEWPRLHAIRIRETKRNAFELR